MRHFTTFFALVILLCSWGAANAQLAKCKGKFLGNIMPSNWSGNTPVVRSDFATYWNQVTPENAGKWGVAEGSRNNFSWSDLDQMYQFCQQNGFPFKQHVFVWGSQQPSWIAGMSHAQQRQEVEEWYAAFAQRYPNTEIIDVVNESLPGHAPDVEFRDALGGFNNGAQNPYLAAHPEYGPYGTGWDYIIYSFAKAREYFPDATLLLNDYNIINNPTAINMHLEIVNILKDRGLIDGVGIQCHAFSVDRMSAQQITNNLNLLASAGLPIHVTELDIRGDNNNETQQRDRYATIFPAFWEHPDVAGITLWGYIEGTTWMEYTGIFNPDGSKRLAMLWLEEYMASQPDLCSSGPIVNFTSPGANEAFTAPASISLEVSATDANGSVTSVQFYNGNILLHTDNSAPYTYNWENLSEGTYEIRAVATDNEGETGEDQITIKVNVPQGPYNGTVHPIPGTIQLEEFDVGGNGFAYMDDSPGSETGVSFRADEDVDIEECTDAGAGYNLGWTTAGEWLEYTVDVETAGSYDMDLRVACSGDGRTVNVSMDGTDIAADVAIPNTAGWQTWQTVKVSGIDLTPGQKIMRLTIGETDYVNLNYVTFTLTKELKQEPFSGTAITVPGRIEAEDYDLGGEGLAYHEANTNGNEGGSTYRNDEVDVEETQDVGGGYNIGYALQGEWLEYTIDVVSTGVYNLGLRLAANGDGKLMHIEIDGVDVTGSIDVPNTGGWQTWETVVVNGISLTEGEHVMRVVFETDYMNLNYMEFTDVITGLSNNVLEAIQVFPNPFSISGFQIKTADLFRYSISDLHGRVIDSGQNNDGSEQLGKDLPKGIYFLTLEQDYKVKTLKIIKQ